MRVFVYFNKQGEKIKLKPEAILCSIVINLGLALGITNQVTPLSLFLIIVNLGHAPPCFLVWLYIFLHNTGIIFSTCDVSKKGKNLIVEI
jgi:hypothetical protein